MNISLNLSDRIDTLRDSRPPLPVCSVSLTFPLIREVARSVFVETHSLLLAQRLALSADTFNYGVAAPA